MTTRVPAAATSGSHTVFRLVQISDTHLPARLGCAAPGWCDVADYIAHAAPNLLVHTGDIVANEPDAEDDHRFARAALDDLAVEWLAVPGNHDVGDGPPAQTVTESLVEKFSARYGQVHWTRDIGLWRLIGVNSMMFGTSLAGEEDEWRFLQTSLSEAGGRPVAIFVHKPPFVLEPGETQVGSASFPASCRSRFWSLVTRHPVRLIACGHRHEYRVLQRDGIAVVWAPTTSALLDESTPPLVPRGTRPGLVEYVFHGASVAHRLVVFDPPPTRSDAHGH